MKRGELLQTPETVSADVLTETHSSVSFEDLVFKRMAPRWLLELASNVAKQSLVGRHWAHLIIKLGPDIREQISGDAALNQVSHVMQEEGFQTDTAYDKLGETKYVQLRVFWLGGKEDFENRGMLGVFNRSFVPELEQLDREIASLRL